ncbi:Ig-like domain-containing protein [Nocardioides hankookensis]|uniref:Ig-like domain-containing protein n=1 Tax=Nocardioides hankookensis TaxID=443157 RepID=A0ABW1LK74_9ACTN
MSDRGLRPLAATAALILAGLVLTACDSKDVPGASALAGDSSESASPTVTPLHVALNVKRGAADVPVDTELAVAADGGTITSVDASSSAGKLPGEVSADGAAWQATGRLEPGTSYVVRTTAEREDGKQVTRTARFKTEDLTLDQQTYPSVAPLADETVGVGMPVIVTFDVPVTDRASFQKHMTVTSKPAQPGAWHWLSDTEAHWRPKTYWKAGTDVHVDVDVNSVKAGNGIYGQESRELDFHVGDAHVYKVNAQTHQMKVFSDGKLLRTLPITTGKPGFTTRSGTKVIIEKFPVKRMNSETVGIPAGSADAYDIDDVQWAMRLTYSGEFIHAAPWSVGSQGYANVSHGCTGMSTDNAKWLYDMSRRGDVVEYTGTDRPMTFDNGYGDWNESFKEFKKGSAL